MICPLTDHGARRYLARPKGRPTDHYRADSVTGRLLLPPALGPQWPCPSCGRPALYACSCECLEFCCAKGHVYHVCHVDQKRIRGPRNHLLPLAACVCQNPKPLVPTLDQLYREREATRQARRDRRRK